MHWQQRVHPLVYCGMVAVLAFVSIWVSPNEDEVRKTVVQVWGGVILTVGLYLAWRRIRVAEEGQITDRFTQAVEQLGNDKVEVHLGGIYALERIAKDSPIKDHWTIMDTLAAFIRMNSRKGRKDARISDDIQAAITVIGRRKNFGEGETHELDLSGTNLRLADLRGPNWQLVNFKRAHLEKAHLEGVDLSMALNLTAEQIQSASIDPTTQLPAYIKDRR